MSDSDYKKFAMELASALAFTPMAPAEALGVTGFDVSAEISVTDIDQSKSYWENMTKDNDDQDPYLSFAKLHIQKGLPFNIDLGAMYGVLINTNASSWGIEAKWAFIEGNTAIPAVAVRVAYSQMLGVDDVDLSQASGELMISKGFLMFTPYASIGAVNVMADSISGNVDSSGVISVDANDVNEAMFRGLVGLQFTPMPLLSIKGEAVLNAGDTTVPSINLSVGLKF
jgi:opacity protein-like surface antigen